MKALITGITGFVGSHLAEYLLSKGYNVYGTKRWRSRMENIEHILDKIKLIEADLNDAHSIENAIKQIKPDYIFHLAGQSLHLLIAELSIHQLFLSCLEIVLLKADTWSGLSAALFQAPHRLLFQMRQDTKVF